MREGRGRMRPHIWIGMLLAAGLAAVGCRAEAATYYEKERR
jgi:hypothetical protein